MVIMNQLDWVIETITPAIKHIVVIFYENGIVHAFKLTDGSGLMA